MRFSGYNETHKTDQLILLNIHKITLNEPEFCKEMYFSGNLTMYTKVFHHDNDYNHQFMLNQW